jgi:regulator of sirC expression with transglutaminase-like and TPR domain
MKGQYDLVVNDRNLGIRLEPEMPFAYLTRGMAYRKLGKIPEALNDFEKFIVIVKIPQLVQIARNQIEELSQHLDE